jgi:beta-galactosidase
MIIPIKKDIRPAFAILFMAASLHAAYQPPETERTRFNFNPGWKVHFGEAEGAETIGFDDSSWKNVTLPNVFNEDEAFKKSIHDLTTGIVWYRKHFKIPAPSGKANCKWFLEFEGIRQGGEFYLNGEFIGRHENGVMAFGFDITEKIKPAPKENILAARIDNSWDYREKSTDSTFQWNDRNFYANYGGINKNVYLHTTGRLYQTLPLFSTLGTTGVFI